MFIWPIKVVKVVDGESVRVIVDRGFRDFSTKDVRLLGIDAPEKSTRAGKLVSSVVEIWLASEAARGKLMLRSFELDKYGRALGNIFSVDDSDEYGETLGEYLLSNGLARFYEGDSRWSWGEEELSATEALAGSILENHYITF